MASRQRSFLDKKPVIRSQWNKPRKPQYVNYDLQPVAKTMSAPAIDASSASKAKLKAFSFVEKLEPQLLKEKYNNLSEDEKENKDTTAQPLKLETSQRSKRTPSQRSAPSSPERLRKSATQEVKEERREYPQTPIGKVPLAELISNRDDMFEQAPSLTPVERILWNHSPHSSDPTSNFITPAARRGNKRARSSSPVSSQNDGSAHSTTESKKQSFDLQPMQRSLRTPQADPANDLWSKYSFYTDGKQTTTTPAAPAIANFLHSSPQTPAPNFRGFDTGLRRSLSCSMEWPTSGAKRRKIFKSHSQAAEKSNFDVPEAGNAPSGSRISRVSLLLERIQESLLKHKAVPQDAGLPSSSQVTCENTIALPSDESPLARFRPESSIPPMSSSQIDVTEEPTVFHCSQQSANLTAKKDEKAQIIESFSEFGDDEIDYDLFEKVDASFQTKWQEDKVSKRLEPEFSIHADTKPSKEATRTSLFASEPDSLNQQEVEVAHVSQPTLQPHLPGILQDLGEDVFDSDGSDLLAADLEYVAALYDQQPPPNSNEHDRDSDDNKLKHESDPYTTQKKDMRIPALVDRTDYVEVSSDNEFGDDLDFEQIEVEYVSATQAAKMESQSHSPDNHATSIIQRYRIVQVFEEEYKTNKGYTQIEKILHVQEEKTKLDKTVTLRQSWLDTACTPGSYVHVLGQFDKGGQCTIDDAKNMLILHPDHLISATVVSESFSCMRKAVLQDRVKATNDSNEPQVYGHILHAIFQEAMKFNRWNSDWLRKTIEEIAARYLETLFEINVEMTRAVAHLVGKVPELQAFAELFVTAQPKPEAIVKDRHGAKALMSINKLLDVEEHVWSPRYGLKGNVDATVQVVMRDSNDERTLTVPLELKTGKNSDISHKAQTALYTLLLSDRYDVQIAYGILYYMETSEVSRIPAIRHELRQMVIQRNELACYVRLRLELPPMMKSPHLCGRCYAQTPCFVYHKLVDDGDGDTSGMKEKFDEVIQHLKPVHQEFFKKWDHLLTKEETDVFKFRRELWTMLSSEREKVGRCFAHVVIEPGSEAELTDAPKINRFKYTFIKQNPPSAFSFAESQITVGEPIVISDEKGHFALANGYVTHVRRRRITVAVDRRLHNARVREKKFDAETNQSFAGIMEAVEEGRVEPTSTPDQSEEQVLYRLDKDEFSNGMATVRNNLIRVMEKDLFGAQPLRRLVIEGVPPTFRPLLVNRGLPETASQANLNVDQRNAIDKVMTAKDYALVLGMPGTGKTTTIAHIIRALATQGKSILLTSYTHTAVDNILLKIRNDGIGIFRLGAIAKIHPEVQEFADLAAVPKKSVEELKRTYNQQIVATTCLGINHPIFSQRIFDYCIVDEASQITLPVCLGPIRMARTFILVGDHYQLPPLVQNKEAQEGGLDVSLFKLLSDQHPSSVVTLEHQYRMCEDIMTLSNTLIYDGRLKCGTSTVASSRISIPRMSALKLHHRPSSTLLASGKPICRGPANGTCWIYSLLNPSVKVAFINTDSLLPLSREISPGSRITNPIEAAITTQLVESLITTGVKPADIGIITLYRSQLALLKQSLRHRCTPTSSDSTRLSGGNGGTLEMHTADKFQGRDKEVVVLSLVRSNESANVGDLLKDWRRVNVALTRARTKLLILGSIETMRKGNELLCRFVELVESRGWRFDLQPGALEEHCFEKGGTQFPGEVDRDGGGGNVIELEEKGKVGVNVNLGLKEEATQNEGKAGRNVFGRRMPQKTKNADVRTLLGRRPVLRDIINEVGG